MRRRKSLGTTGENLATALLKQKRHRILQRNLQTKFGEVDILSLDGPTLVVTEVKQKTTDRFGRAIEMITPEKARKLVLLTQFLSQKFKTANVRIDVVTVDGEDDTAAVKHHKGIIEYNG